MSNKLPFEIVASASNQKMIGELVGGFLPTFSLPLDLWVVCIPQWIYLRVKRKRNYRNLLTTPVSRYFLVGKMPVIILSGLMASFALLGLFLSINFMDIIHPEIMKVVNQILSIGFRIEIILLATSINGFFRRNNDSYCSLHENIQRSPKYHCTIKYSSAITSNGGSFPWYRIKYKNSDDSYSKYCFDNKRAHRWAY